jgi:ATP:cob(I)alamin adenosyltransferase
VVPGASADSAKVHLARAVCRRCERVIVSLFKKDGGSKFILAYINRLADLLFVLAWALEVRAEIRRVVKVTVANLVAGEQL